MADMNYVSPLTSDLTDYYTKSEVDELQQGDAATYATSAEIVAGDNAVKGWVVSQGFLTEHQDLTNYATKDYVAAAVEDIEAGGVSIEVVDTLPAHPEENVIYLTRKSESDTDNIYNEWIWVADTESYELIGDTSSGVIPDLSDYATKQWVEAKGYLVSDNLTGYATVSDLADFATKDYVDDELANKANAADLATVATTGSYNDLSNKPTIPSTSGLASETYVDNAIAAIKGSDIDNDMNWVDEGMAKAFVIDEINNNVSAAGKSGDYDDLTNKPTLFSGDYNDLSNKPVIPSIPSTYDAEDIDYDNQTSALDATNVQDAIDEVFAGLGATTSQLSRVISAAQPIDYDNTTSGLTASTIDGAIDELAASIPTLPTLATVATTGDYDDLTNKPTIPVLPTLATVATSGSYNDLSDKPIIPSGGIEGTADGGLAFIYPELLDNSVRKGYVIWSDTTQDELIEWLKSGYWIRLMNSSCQSGIPIGSFGNHNRVFIYTCNVSTGVITSQYYQYGTLSFAGYGWVVRVLPNAFLYIPCSNTSNMDTETLNAIKKMRENYLLNYDNTTSGLTATTIQGAIDELAAASGGGASTAAQLSYDNTNTWNDGTDTDTVQEAIDTLWNDVAKLPDGYDLTETYNANTKTLNLSITESSGM